MIGRLRKSCRLFDKSRLQTDKRRAAGLLAMPRTNNREKTPRLCLWCLALISGVSIFAWIQGCADSSHESAQDKQARLRGQYVYQQWCATCHEANDLHLLKTPPRLDGLFQKQVFPSGASATDQEFGNVVLHGRGTMPAFEYTLDTDDVNALVRYMHTR